MELNHQAQNEKALHRAVAMLARRPCSVMEIKKKLLESDFDPCVVSAVIERLEKERLLDDRDFCEQWIHNRISHHYGIRKIYFELIQKGVSKELIQEALDKFLTDDTQMDAALSLAEKAFHSLSSETDRYHLWQKMIARLIRRGFSTDIAKEASCRILKAHMSEDD